MLYLHDIWVNWFDGEECGYNVCEFHEWRKSDRVELLDQVPIILIEKALYHWIENSLDELPGQLLEDIYQQAFIRKGNERSPIEYAAVLTDGYGVLAIDTIGYTVPIRKSRLIPRHEQQVFELAKDMAICQYSFTPFEREKEVTALSPHPQTMQGLTRKERQLKRLLLLSLEHLYLSKNLSELRYWFTEWFPERYHEALLLDFEVVWQELFEAVSCSWGSKHEELCEKMTKGQNYLENLWEIEMGERLP